MPKSIYISGKITGLPEDQVRNNFSSAEFVLSQQGWNVINPLWIDLNGQEKTWANFMIEDLKALIPCDAIFMLSNWMESSGAKIEHSFAIAMGKEVYYQSTLIQAEEVTNG